jgi:hypothetical protein
MSDPHSDGQRFDRRRFLGAAAASGALAGGGLLRLAPRALGQEGEPKQPSRFVVIAFAGGVRTRETYGSPKNVPNLRAMADEGVLYPRMATSNLGHFGATLSIFTGISEARGIRENARGEDPTLFEYLRKHAGLPPEQVWVTTSGGAQQVNYSYGLHPDYGVRYGANTLDGDGIFNREFKQVLATYGRPRPMGEEERAVLESLRGSIGEDDRARAASLNTRESAAKVEQYILDELTKGTANVSGAGAPDAKALQVARNLLALFKPTLTAVVLRSADIAHRSYNGYVDVIRRNDAAVGELWQVVKNDPELAESTAIFVLPEFGRDADLNSRRGLDHGDGSDDVLRVAGVAWGPGFRRGVEVRDDVRTIDVTPTICSLMGIEARHAKGRPLPGLMA